jgi:hypothetical protein
MVVPFAPPSGVVSMDTPYRTQATYSSKLWYQLLYNT